MKTERLNLAAVLCFGVLLLLLGSGATQFTMNSQAWDMWAYFRNNPLGALLSGHPHGLRYIVYYPAFGVAQLFDVNPNIVFGYYCAIILLFMSMLIGRILFNLWGGAGWVFRRDAVIIAIFAMSLLMNGRLIFAYCGYVVIMFASIDWFRYRKWDSGHAICMILGMFLAGVSSGTLLIAMALAASVLLIMWAREPETFCLAPHMPLAIVFALVLFSIPAMIGLNKNLAFFGGDETAVVRMLSHGAGGDIASSVGLNIESDADMATGSRVEARKPAPSVKRLVRPVDHKYVLPTLDDLARFWWVAILIVGIGARILGWRPVAMVRNATPQENVLHFAIGLAVLGGFFGYSVLTMTIIPILFLLSRYVQGWPFRGRKVFS